MTILHWIIFAFSAVIFAVSAITIIYPIFFGLERTNLTDKYTWGLGIQGFFFLSAIACGILASISILIIFFSEEIWIFSRTFGWGGNPIQALQLGATIAFACLISAMLIMFADLGRPFRAWRLITSGRITSPLTIDFLSLAILTILSFVFMFGILMNSVAIIMLWAYATLFFVLICLLAHVMLFILRTPPKQSARSFDALTTISCSLWTGTAVMSALLTFKDVWELSDLVAQAFVITTFIVFATQVGVLVSAKLTGQKPHNLAVLAMSFVVLVIAAGTEFLQVVTMVPLIVPNVIAWCLAIVTVFVEKVQMVLHYQKPSLLPAPYEMADQEKPYRPSILEIGNLISGIALAVCIFYAVIIFREFVLPWIVNLFS